MKRESGGQRFLSLRLGIALAGILLAAIYFVGPQEPERLQLQELGTAPGPSATPVAPLREPATSTDATETENLFLTRLQKETWRIGQIDDDPEKTDRELTEWARKLSPAELTLLARTAREIETDPDQRFLAVDLLGRAGTVEAGDLLVEIAIEPLAVEFASDYQHSASAEFEVLLREQAVDSIAELPPERADHALAKVLGRVNRSTLVDRIQRHRAALKAHVPPVKDQEKQALSKLLSF